MSQICHIQRTNLGITINHFDKVEPAPLWPQKWVGVITLAAHNRCQFAQHFHLLPLRVEGMMHPKQLVAFCAHLILIEVDQPRRVAPGVKAICVPGPRRRVCSYMTRLLSTSSTLARLAVPIAANEILRGNTSAHCSFFNEITLPMGNPFTRKSIRILGPVVA